MCMRLPSCLLRLYRICHIPIVNGYNRKYFLIKRTIFDRSIHAVAINYEYITSNENQSTIRPATFKIVSFTYGSGGEVRRITELL